MVPLWGFIVILVVSFNTLSPGVQAAQSTYLNFQARLLSSSGAVVSDGFYHVEFKLYNQVSGGSALWTETWSSGDNSNRIRVVNGYLTANLGADTAFPSTIAWDQQLWLTMNIGGTGGAASWDGEMNPRILLTALPYAFKSAETLAVKKVDGANTGTLNFNTVANNPAINLPDASGTVCLQSSTSCGFVAGDSDDFIQNGTSVQTANFNIQSAAAGSIAALISGASGQSVDILQVKANGVTDPLFKISSTGDAIFKGADSATAFQVQDSGGTAILAVNTSADGVTVNGLTSLVANGAAHGDALVVTNAGGTGNIAIFNDDATAVLTIVDGGRTTISPIASNTGSALTVNQAGNPTAGNALIKANNTNGTPSGNLLDLQAGGNSRFSVDTGGSFTFGDTGNANSAIRKRMNVSGTVAANDVVILHTTAGTVIRTTTAADTKVFGVATGSGTPQEIVIGGVYQVNLDSTTANITIGDFLVTSTEAGMVTKSTNPTTGAVLGRALSTTGSASAGQKVWVYVTPGTGGSTDSLQTAYENSATTEISLNSTNNGINIWDNMSPVTGNLFSVQSYNASTTYLGVSASGTTLTGTLSQTASLALASPNGFTQTLTNASDNGGNMNGLNQSITVTNTLVAGSTNGVNISIADNASLANTNTGIKISLSGTNSAQTQVGINAAVNRGVGIKGVSSGDVPAGSGETCGGLSLAGFSFGVCGNSTSTNGLGVLGVSSGKATTNIATVGSGVSGYNENAGTAGEVYNAVTGFALQTANAAYTSIGVHGMAASGSGAAGYGGYFQVLSSGSGAALYASNMTTTSNILQLQDGSGTPTNVMTVSDGGLVAISPVSSQTGSALSVTQAGNPTAGNALIVANNTNGTPSGNLLALQTNGTTQLSVDTAGSISTNGHLIFAGTGNTAGTIRKRMIVTSAVNIYDIVVYDSNSNPGQVTTTNTADSTRVFGVATATNSAGVAQDIVVGGVFQITIDGDNVADNEVNVGDFITTTNLTGLGKVNNGASSGTAIGRALSRDDANDRVWIYVSPGGGGAPVDLQQAYNLSTGTDITLESSASAGLQINAGNIGAGTTLFEVQSANGLTKYLDVTSNGISVTGTATVSTSVQTPLLTTVTGALTLETGSAAAINIGSASSPTTNAINLNVNTSVTAGRSLTVAGGLTSLVANAGANGDALVVTNAGGLGNIAVFNDDAVPVLTIVDGGRTAISPISSQTGSALTITQAGNPSAGNALIKANNTNGTPSGDLLSLQTNGTSQLSVNTNGTISTNGQLSFAQSGNAAATIQKRTTVSTAVNQYDIVIIDTAATDGKVATTTSANSTQVFGVATATNAGTNVAQDIVTGGVYQINIVPADGVANDDVNVGDFITTSTTAGRGQVNNSAPAGTVIGRALSRDDTNNRIWIYVTPGAGGSPTSLQQAYNLSTTPEITLIDDVNHGAVTIQDASTPLAGNANLFEVQNNGGATKYFAVNNQGVSVTGTATISTSLQVPLITTGSGNLSLQPATGIVTLNRASTANELRVYENAASPSNYISVKQGSVTVSSGNLTIDAGSSSTIHIGTSGSPVASAINLNINTTVASGRSLTVAGGATTLTADGASSGEALIASNSTGNGNIARFRDGSGAGSDVVTIANHGYTTFKNVTNSTTAFQIQNAIGSNALTVDTTSINSFLTNGNFEATDVSAWTAKGNATIARNTAVGPYIGLASLQVTNGDTNAGNGVKYDVALSNATTYALSFSVRIVSGTALSASNFEVGWNNGSTDAACSLNPSLTNQAPVSSGWVRYTCTFTGSTSGHVYWKTSAAVGTAPVFNIDAVQLEQANAATAYKETAISLNGTIDSPMALRNKNDSTAAFQVQNASGASAFVVDTLNRRVGIALNSAPTQALEVGGNILASGNVTASDFNFSNGSTASRRYSLTRTLPDSISQYVEIGNFNVTDGSHNLIVSTTVNTSGFSTSKLYNLALQFAHTSNTWQDVLPTYDGGPYNSNNFVLEVNVNGSVASLRLRRTAGATSSAVVHVNIEQLGATTDTFTSQSGVGSSSSSGIFNGTSMVQDGATGRVGIQNAAPAYTLDVNGIINTSSYVLTPGIVTASGSLGIQAANGVVAINTASVANDLRVYENAATPTNYTSLKHGSLTSSSGALAIDTGSAAAVNIGTTTANAINLGTDTTVASTKNFTVSGGVTSLTANGGNALQVTNASGSGNIAIFSDDATPVLTIGNQGIFTFRNIDNNSNGFQLQNSGGFASLVFDTTNKHLKIYENTAGAPTNYADIYYDNATSTANYTASSGTVAVGTGAGAITINAGSGAAINMTANAASLWRTTAGTLTLQSGTSSNLILNAGSSIVQVNGSSVLQLGSNAGDPTCTTGAIVYNSSTGKLRGCEAGSWRNLVNTFQDAYTISTGSTTPEIKLDSTRTSLDIQDADSTLAGDLFTVRASNASGLGNVLLGTDNSGNTRLQNASGTTLFRANASSSRVEIGSPTSHASNPIILVLDNYNNATEPTGTNGALYYNVVSNKFRCYENGVWKDCINGFNTITKTADQAATPNNTFFINDNTLAFSVAANTSYIFEAWIPIDTSLATSRYTFTAPTGASLKIMSERPSASTDTSSTSNTNHICNIVTSGFNCLDTVAAATHFIKVNGYLRTGGTSGTLQFQFSQNSSDGDAYPVIKAGATLSWHTTN